MIDEHDRVQIWTIALSNERVMIFESRRERPARR